MVDEEEEHDEAEEEAGVDDREKPTGGDSLRVLRVEGPGLPIDRGVRLFCLPRFTFCTRDVAELAMDEDIVLGSFPPGGFLA